MRIGLSFDQGTPKYRLYLGALLAAADHYGVNVQPIWLADPDRAHQDPTLQVIDGLILTGGADVEPHRYGYTDPDGICETFPRRDDAELQMTHVAMKRRLPILAICRGLQLLNVYRGGTLTPHLAAAPDHQLRDDERHQVQVEPTSPLFHLTHTGEGAVGSHHHQAVAKLGRGLEAVAWHADRTVEAIAWSNPMRKPWLIAVQWHPERMGLDEPLAGPLFGGFLQAVKARST